MSTGDSEIWSLHSPQVNPTSGTISSWFESLILRQFSWENIDIDRGSYKEPRESGIAAIYAAPCGVFRLNSYDWNELKGSYLKPSDFESTFAQQRRPAHDTPNDTVGHFLVKPGSNWTVNLIPYGAGTNQCCQIRSIDADISKSRLLSGSRHLTLQFESGLTGSLVKKSWTRLFMWDRGNCYTAALICALVPLGPEINQLQGCQVDVNGIGRILS